MPITTTLGHVSRAMDFFNKPDLYFAFGKQSPWEDESIPEPPSVDMENIVEPLGYKMVENKYMVIPDDEGTILYRDSRWKIVPFNKSIEEKSRWVYIETFIRYDELPLGSYRQIGVYSGLKKNEEVSPSKMALIPEDVKYSGILEFIDNRLKVTRQLDQKEQFSLIIEF